ncbi:MAG: hypothetical protein Q7R83_00175 [bacterium]|nr:hypothetical protein [bacterium]
MIRINEVRPLYRHVMREALKTAWHERKLWVFALFAGVLQTGGVYDVLITSFRDMIAQIQSMPEVYLRTYGTSVGVRSWMQTFSSSQTWINLAIGIVFVVIILGISFVAQGALVHGIQTRAQGNPVRFKESLRVGWKHLLSIFGLNVLSLGVLWLVNAFLYIPVVYVLRGPSVWNVLATLALFILLCVVTVCLTAVHMFGLQLIVQSGGFWKNLRHTWSYFERSWVIVIEKAFLLLLIGMGILAAAIVLGLIVCIPGFLIFLAAMTLGFWTVASVVSIVSWLLFFVVLILAAVFAITFQYAAWHGVFVRLNEGQALSKWHRFTKWLHEEARLFHR